MIVIPASRRVVLTETACELAFGMLRVPALTSRRDSPPASAPPPRTLGSPPFASQPLCPALPRDRTPRRFVHESCLIPSTHDSGRYTASGSLKMSKIGRLL